MTNFLFAKNKIGFVDGSIKKPESSSTLCMPWMRADAMIKRWLTTAMEKDIRSSVKYNNTACEIWTDLQERFGKKSAPRAYELKQCLTLTQQDGSFVTAYFTKLKGLWDEIESVLPTPHCTCDGCLCGIGKKLFDLKQKERLYEFLMGLDTEFSVIRTQILAMQPMPNLNVAFHLVYEDEQQRQITIPRKPSKEAAAFQASFPRREVSQQKRGSQKNEKLGLVDKTDHCTFCGRDGHNREGCFKRIGYPEWWPGKGKKENTKPKDALVETKVAPIETNSSPNTGLD
ncbi:uncharacterized protein LOC143609813 [Bidens hawaiensis]|uniref:uncharacterized protein LOC143609813 n=1 Tax=Bidens hawaiensis TaxID=980011 RepID=UPI00404AFBD9